MQLIHFSSPILPRVLVSCFRYFYYTDQVDLSTMGKQYIRLLGRYSKGVPDQSVEGETTGREISSYLSKAICRVGDTRCGHR